jgi:hypothetical protein
MRKMDEDSKLMDYGPWTADASCSSARSILKLVDAPLDVNLGLWDTSAKQMRRLGSSGFLLRTMPPPFLFAPCCLRTYFESELTSG